MTRRDGPVYHPAADASNISWNVYWPYPGVVVAESRGFVTLPPSRSIPTEKQARLHSARRHPVPRYMTMLMAMAAMAAISAMAMKAITAGKQANLAALTIALSWYAIREHGLRLRSKPATGALAASRPDPIATWRIQGQARMVWKAT